MIKSQLGGHLEAKTWQEQSDHGPGGSGMRLWKSAGTTRALGLWRDVDGLYCRDHVRSMELEVTE